MYGAMIGDIVGSKYEFHNIKTKDFPLFSEGCDYTDDTIMTAAVAKAILLARVGNYENGKSEKGFQDFLVETMQDFGRRYPHPTGAYGGMFADWLRQKNPKPYGSFGNGAAMRVSPCGLAAVNLDEALALARASAAVTHDHPEGIKGAEAVAAAVFLAKSGKSREEIRRYIGEHYYHLNFTLDSIRDTYEFDASCQGSVPQAIVAFLESENFEDAVRNAVSFGGDCDTTGAIAGSIVWVYYAVQSGQYEGWVENKFDPAMLEIKARAMEFLPKEFIDIAEEFHEVCWKRAGTYERVGSCTPILIRSEARKYRSARPVPSAVRGDTSQSSTAAFAGLPGESRRYTLDFVRAQENRPGEQVPGACVVTHDEFLHKWRLQFQLDEERLWFFSVFLREDGSFDTYSLDEEAASDSHYEFQEEQEIRKKLYVPGDEDRYFHEILLAMGTSGAGKLCGT